MATGESGSESSSTRSRGNGSLARALGRETVSLPKIFFLSAKISRKSLLVRLFQEIFSKEDGGGGSGGKGGGGERGEGRKKKAVSIDRQG